MRYKITGELRIAKNKKLTDLVGSPEYADYYNILDAMALTSLKGIKKVGRLDLIRCKNLKSLEYCPSIVPASIDISFSGIESLEHIPTKTRYFTARGYNGKFTINQIREKCQVIGKVHI